MDKIKERASAMLTKINDLKQRRDDANALVAELEKDKDKLPTSSKAALSAFKEKKQGGRAK